MSAPIDVWPLPGCPHRTDLLLAGAHHRGGSEMLTRVMDSLCQKCYGARRRRRPSSASPCLVDVEVGSRRPGSFNATSIARLYESGIRLISSGQWAIQPAELAAALGAVPWRMVHLIRPPRDVIVSSYFYHLGTSEPWALEREPPWYGRMGLQPPLPAGYTFRRHLNKIPLPSGVLLQAQHSMRSLAAMAAVAEGCAQLPQRCTNLWLEGFHCDFDSAARAMLASLGCRGAAPTAAPHPSPLLAAVRQAASLSAAQRTASAHVTRWSPKRLAEQATALSALEASALGAALRRLHARLRRSAREVYGAGGVTSGGTGGMGAAELRNGRGGDGGAASCGDEGMAEGEETEARRGASAPDSPAPSEHTSGAPPPRHGWWSSLEPTRTLYLDGPRQNGPDSCRAACRAATDPGCLAFNWRAAKGGEPGSRCTLLVSRAAFHASKQVLTGEI